jgi:hypothetical protein
VVGKMLAKLMSRDLNGIELTWVVAKTLARLLAMDPNGTKCKLDIM